MADPYFSGEKLVACLSELPELNLLGMRLLQARPRMDISRDVLQEAVTEIITYTDHCQATADRLRSLTPIPLTTIPLLEFAS